MFFFNRYACFLPFCENVLPFSVDMKLYFHYIKFINTTWSLKMSLHYFNVYKQLSKSSLLIESDGKSYEEAIEDMQEEYPDSEYVTTIELDLSDPLNASSRNIDLLEEIKYARRIGEEI